MTSTSPWKVISIFFSFLWGKNRTEAINNQLLSVCTACKPVLPLLRTGGPFIPLPWGGFRAMVQPWPRPTQAKLQLACLHLWRLPSICFIQVRDWRRQVNASPSLGQQQTPKAGRRDLNGFMGPRGRHRQQVSLFPFEWVYTASPTSILKKRHGATGLHFPSIRYVRLRSNTKPGWLWELLAAKSFPALPDILTKGPLIGGKENAARWQMTPG